MNSWAWKGGSLSLEDIWASKAKEFGWGVYLWGATGPGEKLDPGARRRLGLGKKVGNGG